ncbi:MAG TPA: hypothetical protein VNO14_08085 [Blastocatellia bacterium]|nr:hypothetical protein [Blastocatellia bacterium]
MLTRRSIIVSFCCLLLFYVMTGPSKADGWRAQGQSVATGEQTWKLETVAAPATASKPQPREVERRLALPSAHIEPLLLLLLGSFLLAIATGIKSLLSRKPIKVDR